jgi:predicted NACHT family NTPase
VGKLELHGFANLEDKVRKGFVLLAGPGEGKTTWTQFAAANLSRKYISFEPEGRVPILFSLVRWLPDRSLHEALHETFASYAPCGRWVFDRLLKSGNVVVLLDGYDELWQRDLPFSEQLHDLRAEYPTVAWTLISRSDKPTPSDLGERESLTPPTDAELQVIKRRLKNESIL